MATKKKATKKATKKGTRRVRSKPQTDSIQDISGKRGLDQPPYFLPCLPALGLSPVRLFHRPVRGLCTSVYKLLYTFGVSLPHLLLGLLSRAIRRADGT